MDAWHIRELITRRAYRICMLPAVSFALLTRGMADILFPWLLPIYVCFFLSTQAERRYNSKLYDMRDRLDQANSTTRSMQNYVSFLKSSYSNVFDELESPR